MDAITLTRTDGSTFALTPRMPKSYAARNDVISAYNAAVTANDAAKMERTLMACLGLVTQEQAPASEDGGSPPGMPRYDLVNAHVMRYGGRVIEHLYSKWDVAPSAGLYSGALAALNAMVESMPRTRTVEELTNFTSANGEPGTT